MADQKITDLTALTGVADADLLAIIDDVAGTPVTKKVTIAELLKLAVRNVVIQVLTSSSGTYTPTAGMKKVLAIAVGGGGGAPAATGADEAVSGGGGGGAAIRLLTAAQIGASKAYAVGQTSTSGGNSTTLDSGTLLQATGGAVGVATGNSTTLGTQAKGGQGGIGSNGDINIRGGSGGPGTIFSTSQGQGGMGGNSIFGGGGRGGVTSTTFEQGEAGGAYGGGAGGGHTSDGTDLTAVAGAAGVLIMIEFLEA